MDTQTTQRMHQLTAGVLTTGTAPDEDSIPFEPKTNKTRPDYLPSPNQIREECRKIRADWSEREHWKRAGYQNGKPKGELRPVHVHCDVTA